MMRKMPRSSTLPCMPPDEEPPSFKDMNTTLQTHQEHLGCLINDAKMFKMALLSLHDASRCLAKRFTEYGSLFTDKSDPDIAASARCCERSSAFFESLSQSLTICGTSVENDAIEDCKKCMSQLSSAHESGKHYSAAFSAAAEAKKKKSDTVNSRKSVNLSHNSHREIERTRTACEAAEREFKSLYGTAVHDVNLVTMRSFISFYEMLGKLFESETSLYEDYKNYRDEFLSYCNDSSRAVEQGSAEQCSDTDTDAETDADADDGSEEALIDNTQDCYIAITDNFSKYTSFLLAYGDILSKMQVDLTGTKISPNDVARLAKATQEIHTEFSALEEKMKSRAQSDNLIPTIAEVITDMKQRLEEPYKRYFECAPHVQFIFERHQKNKVIRAGQKQYEQRCLPIGLTQAKWEDSVDVPVRFPDLLLSELRTLSKRVPSENPAWDLLHNAESRLTAFDDFVKEAKTRSKHMLDLLNLRERLPEEKNLVSIARIFCAEGKLTCVSATAPAPGHAPGAGGPPPLPGHTPALPGAISPPLHGISGSLTTAASGTISPAGEDSNNVQAGHTYFTFLFSDMILFCVPKKKGSLEKGFVTVKRFNTRSLSFDKAQNYENGFRLAHSGGTMIFTVDAEDYKMWTDKLKSVITDRNQNVVFGVALNKLMERCPDRIVPSVLSDAAEYIKENAKDAEGIFRLSVTSNILLEVQEMIDSGKAVMYTDVYVAANIIKSWLRALPEPLLTFNMYDAWIAAQDDPKALHELVTRLPKDNSFTLSALIRLMKDISVYSDVTRMTSSNLAIVIAPNILYRRGDEMNISQGPTNVVDTLILNYDDIFRDIIKKETDKAKLVGEVERCRSNTLRKRASKLANNVNGGGTLPILGGGDQKKGHHQTSTQASLMSIFARDSSNKDVIPPPSVEPPPPSSSSNRPPPTVSVRRQSQKASTLSSSAVSSAVNELLKYTEPSTTPPDLGGISPKDLPSFSGLNLEGNQSGADKKFSSLQLTTNNDSINAGAEFDVSDITFGDVPGTPMANPDILPPPLLPSDVQISPPPDVPPPEDDDIPPPPPLPDDIPPPPLP